MQLVPLLASSLYIRALTLTIKKSYAWANLHTISIFNGAERRILGLTITSQVSVTTKSLESCHSSSNHASMLSMSLV